MPRKSITPRTVERLHRLAYDLEALAARFGSEGFAMEGNSLKQMASTMGNLARGLDRKITETEL